MQAYFGERGCEFDQASAILDSTEEAWRETKMRPREWEMGWICSSQYGDEFTIASPKTKTPALQAIA